MKTEWSVQPNTGFATTSGSVHIASVFQGLHFEGAGIEISVLSVSQFAAAARITPQAVRKMIAEGRLKAAKIGEQHVIAVEELNEYLSTQ